MFKSSNLFLNAFNKKFGKPYTKLVTQQISNIVVNNEKKNISLYNTNLIVDRQRKNMRISNNNYKLSIVKTQKRNYSTDNSTENNILVSYIVTGVCVGVCTFIAKVYIMDYVGPFSLLLQLLDAMLVSALCALAWPIFMLVLLRVVEKEFSNKY
ncbi:hypothetical protein Catovirus_1_30 [Catovirus CTV1]|uniref:Uncharacterized protein n=1 Tax=Catovirus CTV1 TaxID=1977631 RepID=A0A1V0S8E6_9VIRU|nr:hypothetical protein Catovirus_1_30 [Catovirus CTV1]